MAKIEAYFKWLDENPLLTHAWAGKGNDTRPAQKKVHRRPSATGFCVWCRNNGHDIGLSHNEAAHLKDSIDAMVIELEAAGILKPLK